MIILLLTTQEKVGERIAARLRSKYNYIVQTTGQWEYIGLMGAIGFENPDGFLTAGADPRADAQAYGW